MRGYARHAGEECRLHRSARDLGQHHAEEDAFSRRDGSSFPVDRDGTFRARIRIPETAPPGRAVIRVTGFDVDELYDEVCSERECGTYGATVVVR